MLITGNPAFRYNLLNDDTKMLVADNSLWKKLKHFSEKSFLLGAGTLPKREMALSKEGLEPSHAYAITDIIEFDDNKLLKLKNPWGMSFWCGDWSQYSSNGLIECANSLSFVIKKRRDKRKESKTVILGESSPLEPTVCFPHHRNSSFFISWEDFARSIEVIFVSMTFDESWNSFSFKDKWGKGKADDVSLNLQQ